MYSTTHPWAIGDIWSDHEDEEAALEEEVGATQGGSSPKRRRFETGDCLSPTRWGDGGVPLASPPRKSSKHVTNETVRGRTTSSTGTAKREHAVHAALARNGTKHAVASGGRSEGAGTHAEVANATGMGTGG